ncbi:MAG: exodeoxyribonuclease VII large subunit [Silvanigrellaceae bacterium]|nr:exodeoxyribonuclease VII large subunit [Silvanigrellaceae bacterium]
MSLFFFIENSKIIMTGETFPVKEKIKALGARWNSTHKNWFVEFSEEKSNYLQKIGFQQVQNSAPLSSLSHQNAQTPPPESGQPLTVSQFVGIIDKTIKSYLADSYWITGEISSFKNANNHFFFDLIDKDTSKSYSLKAVSISCVLWSGKREFLAEKINKLPLADGTKIKVLVHCDFRSEGARILAIIDDIDDSFTIGNMLLNRQTIVRELKSRGLYDRNKAHTFSKFPLNISLITAANSRACSDFLDELRISHFPFKVTIYDCNMQGENTSENITQALQQINLKSSVQQECIVITRGGGSRLDLRWFDDLEIAKQIAYCKYPILCAVGHFEDISIADEVSWRSEKTPTGAARFLVNTFSQSLQAILDQFEYLKILFTKKLSKELNNISKLEEKIIFHARKKFQIESVKINNLEKLIKAYQNTIEQCLSKGYGIVRSSEGEILKSLDLLNYPESHLLQIEMMSQDRQERIVADVRFERAKKIPVI